MNECITNNKNISLNFSQAIQALQWGKMIARKSWDAEKAIAFSDEDMAARDWIASIPLNENSESFHSTNEGERL